MQRSTKSKTLCCCRSMQTFTCELINASYVPTPQNKPEDKSSAKAETIGEFQRLPMVMPSVDVFHSALRKAKRVLPTKGIANIARRERNRGAKQLDAFTKVLKKVDALRKKVVSVGEEHASLCAKSLSKREAEERLTEGLE